MGCDIHAYVEIKRKNNISDHDWSFHCTYHFSRNYTLFALLSGVRRYSAYPNVAALEIALAKRGVKTLNDPKLSEVESQTILQEACDTGITHGQLSFEEKGIPQNISYKTAEEYTYVVLNEDDEIGENWTCTRQQADSWLKSNSSEVWNTDSKGNPLRITGPDWHTGSWLNTEEVKQLVVRYHDAIKKQQAEDMLWARNGLKLAKTAKDAKQICFFERELTHESDWSIHNPLRELAYVNSAALAAMMDMLDTHGFNARLVFWFDN